MEILMRIATTIFATVAGLTVGLALSGVPGTAAAQTLPGYSARPEGMCWTRLGSGPDIAGGHWAACPKTAGNPKARAPQQREPANSDARVSAAQHLSSHDEPPYMKIQDQGIREGDGY
jgi:hypothetical protein